MHFDMHIYIYIHVVIYTHNQYSIFSRTNIASHTFSTGVEIETQKDMPTNSSTVVVVYSNVKVFKRFTMSDFHILGSMILVCAKQLFDRRTSLRK